MHIHIREARSRRWRVLSTGFLVLLVLGAGCGVRDGKVEEWNGGGRDVGDERQPETTPADEWSLTDEEWRARLTPEQYRIARMKGTERPGTGAYERTKTPGTYTCVCCGYELFRSETKFDAHCGWPSFTAPAEDAHVTEVPDHSLGSVRTEVVCTRCGAHLGHVFPDGPGPTGLRYCINSASLDLEEDKVRAPDATPEEPSNRE